MISKQDLLKLARKEFETTLKVLNAYPEGQESFKPHERSSDAMKLVSTFVFEMYLTAGYLFGENIPREKFTNYKPENMKAAITDFKKETTEILARLDNMPEEDLTRSVEFGGAKFDASSFFHMMICDQIHHRGQLTVYVRMAGGKVPSIYGPSADDSTTNL